MPTDGSQHAGTPRLAWTSDRTVRLEVDPGPNAARVVGVWARALRAGLGPAVLDAVPAARAVTLVVDPVRADPAALNGRVREIVAACAREEAFAGRVVEIPVAYGGAFGPDLAGVASMAGVRPDEVIQRHAGGVYAVEFFGFSPGFGYLSGLDPSLHTARLEQARTRVPAGSVGIGGSHTGVYPQAMPGGWRVIGRTPVTLFDADRDPPALLAVGDTVRFVPIDAGEFERVRARSEP